MSITSVAGLPSTGVWNIDSVHSTVNFSVRHHAVATFRSTFTNITGAYDADARRLAGEVAVSDISLAGLDRLKGHLLTPDFFDAEQYPTFSFTSTDIQPGDELTVHGELTLRGVTKPIVATGSVVGPQTVTHGGDRGVSERLGIDLAAVIDRREFGIDFNNEVAAGIVNLGWDVSIDAALELVLATDEG